MLSQILYGNKYKTEKIFFNVLETSSNTKNIDKMVTTR